VHSLRTSVVRYNTERFFFHTEGPVSAVLAEGQVEQRQQTECRNIDWGCRFCPTTPSALPPHCCCLQANSSINVIRHIVHLLSQDSKVTVRRLKL